MSAGTFEMFDVIVRVFASGGLYLERQINETKILGRYVDRERPTEKDCNDNGSLWFESR